MAARGVPAPCTKGQLMFMRAVSRFAFPLLGCAALALAGCGSATAPDPVIQSETFTCALQVQQPVAALAQELFAPSGASAGSYCVQIYDCPTGTTGCTSMLTEPV